MIQPPTRVAIVGAGPAGLLLGLHLARNGIDFVIVENRSREYVQSRVRAGVLEQGSVEVLTGLGVGARLASEGLIHDGIYLQFDGARHHIDFASLIGRTVTVYGQQEVVKDLIEEHDRLSSRISYDAGNVELHQIDGSSPLLTYQQAGTDHEIAADFIVGADGFHGISRPSMPSGLPPSVQRGYPYAWLGILADVAPSSDELIYCLHNRGFAMHSMRSSHISRLYLQVTPGETTDDWSDQRIWDELQERLALPGWTLHEGPVLEKSITPMRSFVAGTLAFGRLFLIGDAGHIVPPTGAKGLNSAIADVALLGEAFVEYYQGDESGLASYGEKALRRQWKIQQFSQWMTDMLHRAPDDDAAGEFRYQSQLGQLCHIVHSTFAQQMLAEQYTGLPLVQRSSNA